MSDHATQPESVVARQLDAYNARALDAFMRCWAEDARIYAWPDTLIADGAAAIRERHRVRFAEPLLQAQLLSRIEVGGLVVDHERVTRNYPEGPGTAEVIGLYEVRDGMIRTARFQQDAVRLQVST